MVYKALHDLMPALSSCPQLMLGLLSLAPEGSSGVPFRALLKWLFLKNSLS